MKRGILLPEMVWDFTTGRATILKEEGIDRVISSLVRRIRLGHDKGGESGFVYHETRARGRSTKDVLG